MKKQEYLVLQRNSERLIYNTQPFHTYASAYKNTTKHDTMLVCKYGSIYYGDNWKGWCVDSKNIIRVITK